MNDLAARIDRLSPEKRQLLERMLEQKGVNLSGLKAPTAQADPAESVPPEPVDSPQGMPRVAAETPDAAQADASAGGVKDQVRSFYDSVSQQLTGSIYGRYALFLNYGYVVDGSPQYAAVKLPEHVFNRNAAQLVLEVIGQQDLAGRRVLDVGCGRGGAVDLVARYFPAKEIVGVDLSPQAIAFCRSYYNHPHATFRVGDAEELPLAADSVDVVLNIESSHSYPNIPGFYREVYRVLRPGGFFLYADNLEVALMRSCRSLLQAMGFDILLERDITANVLLSCDQQAMRNLQSFGEGDPAVLDNFLAVPGSEIYQNMLNGRSAYQVFRMQKAR